MLHDPSHYEAPPLAEEIKLSGGDIDNLRRLAGQEAEIQRFRQAVAKLPERQREAFTCRYFLKMSIEDTCKAMDCAEGTVKSACASACENIRGKMGVEYEQPTRQRPGA